jgi:hypothetical protein
MTYADPSTPTGVDLKRISGSLVLIDVKAVEHDIVTAYGNTDAIRCDLAVLDGELKGEEYTDTLLFPRVLQSQLRSFSDKPGVKCLARLGQGTAKPGQSAPWVLNPATDEDRATAAKYEAYVASKAAPATATVADPF